MMYRSILLELIRDHPDLHQELTENRTLLATIDRLAGNLKLRHETLIAQMSRAQPEQASPMSKNEAFEIAILEIEEAVRAGRVWCGEPAA